MEIRRHRGYVYQTKSEFIPVDYGTSSRERFGTADQDFFAATGGGLELIHDNAVRLWQSAALLVEQEHFRGADVLKGIAQEEAAKYLILLDVVRCPRQPDEERFARQLGKFNRHLARGLYAEICDWRPAELKEVREGIERECQAYYLDGPNGVDWIFRNDIERQREESLYVDYVEYDGGHEWISPKKWEALRTRMFFHEPVVLRLVRALHEVGFAKPASLAVIAQIWRAESFGDDTDHVRFGALARETVQRLAGDALPNVVGHDAFSYIVDRWPFPLYDFPMKRIEVSKEELRAIQERWHPDV